MGACRVNRSRILLPIAIALAFGVPFGASAAEAQWIYVASGPRGPTAIFLDFTLSAVILRFDCDLRRRELVLIAPDTASLKGPHELGLDTGDGAAVIAMKSSRLGDGEQSTARDALVGRVRVSRMLAERVLRSRYFDVIAPNDMDEPWHVGRAEPLRRIVQFCSR
jgi:hypothetical protein